MEVLKSSCTVEKCVMSVTSASASTPYLSNGQLTDEVCYALRVYDMLLILWVEFDAGSAEIL